MLSNVIDLADGGRSEAEIDQFPDECPWCEEGGTPSEVQAHSLGKPWDYEEILEVVFQCPRNDCKRYYLAYYHKVDRMGELFFLYRFGAPRYYKQVEFPNIINEISLKFSDIYNEAYMAEGMKLMQICGCGYRKALEFLIKDYLVSKNPEKKSKIEESWLGDAIKMIDDSSIKVCAERATWLGNDESHYVRLFEDKDIENLKDLIRLTVGWIDREITTSKYQTDMQPKSNKQPSF